MSAVTRRAAAVAALLAPLAWIAAPAGAQTMPAAPPSDDAQLDPSSPMAPLPDLGVAWPDLSAPADLSAPPDLSAPDALPDATPAPAIAHAPGPARTGDADTARRYTVTVTGIEDLGPGFRARFAALSALEQNEGKPANAAQIDRRATEDSATLRQLLHAAGRYDGAVESRVEPGGDRLAVTLAVAPGRAYRVARVDLPGLAAAGSKANALAGSFAVRPGDTVDADRVTAEVAAFLARLGHEGYPFAKVAEPTVTADHATGLATLSLPVDPGRPARVGRIVPTGNRPVFTAHHLGEIARFGPGQPYDAVRMDDLRRALVQTSLVSVATVTPVPTADPGTVDIQVLTEPAPPRTVAGQLGYGTGEGARAELSWQHRNLLPPEGAVTVRGIAGTREQLLSATLRRSNYHARDRVLNAQVAASHSNLNAYDARTFSISANLERQTNIVWQKKWTWSAGTELIATDERDTIQATGEGRRRTFFVVAVPASLGYDGSDDLLNPTTGYRLSGRLSPEASVRRGFDGYLRMQVDASAYWPVTQTVVLAGRVRAAAIDGTATATIAPSRRLYAGGGGSVRGFSYQRIGPVDIDNDPVGGRGLAEFGAEARIRFGAFGIVPFLDGGSLTDRAVPTLHDMRFGTGLGGRYYSSFGPIRIDVGTPIARRRGESRIAVYVSLGQAF